jgi:hypothetical protein
MSNNIRFFLIVWSLGFCLTFLLALFTGVFKDYVDEVKQDYLKLQDDQIIVHFAFELFLIWPLYGPVLFLLAIIQII